jgi:murein peptide amidase A
MLLASVCGCALRAAPGVTPQWQIMAHSIRGYPIDVVRCGTGMGGVLVIGGTHGDETGSASLVRELAVRLECATHGAITVVPALNPDGLGIAERSNALGVDLNRNLPTQNWTARPAHGPEPLSEPESRALYDVLLRVRPAFTISVHEASVALVDWDGPADDAARALGACTGLEARRIGAMPGSLGSLLGIDWGWPLVTLELPREASRMSGEALWATYGDCLLSAIGQPHLGLGHPSSW